MCVVTHELLPTNYTIHMQVIEVHDYIATGQHLSGANVCPKSESVAATLDFAPALCRWIVIHLRTLSHTEKYLAYSQSGSAPNLPYKQEVRDTED